MKSVTFEYHGEIRGQGRPRFRRAGKHVQTYENKEDTQYKADILAAYKAAAGAHSFGKVPLLVSIDVYRALPKSRPKSCHSEFDTYKPDSDNIAKAVLDALNGYAFKDDAQIVCLRVYKHERTRREPYMTISITSLDACKN